jgi:hypothetical protein
MKPPYVWKHSLTETRRKSGLLSRLWILQATNWALFAIAVAVLAFLLATLTR